MKFIFMVVALVATASAHAQSNFTAYIRDINTQEPLTGATVTVEGTRQGVAADANGLVVITGVSDGTQVITYRFMGFAERSDTLIFPRSSTDTLVVLLEEEEEEMEEITVSSTRSNRSIADEPTRVEFIAGEELDEKANMKPGDIRMLLNESTGIQTQQTSATSANASVRIQGLDGRYTQILKDGFPLYSGAASGLGLLQTPPLDLKQVEVIKGAASTLYGGGAIAGLVNLISKTPSGERELRFHFDATTARGLNLNGFYGQRFGKMGVTVFASRNSNAPYDPADVNLTAIPKFTRYVLNPKLFLYPSDKTTLYVGLNSAIEDRTGGDIRYVRGEANAANGYFERNETQRYSTQLGVEHRLNPQARLNFKNSYGYFNRVITTPGYRFDGLQHSTFTEATYAKAGERLEWVGGLNAWTDFFNETPQSTFPERDYQQTTLGAFVQNTWKASEKMALETGLRADHVMDYGWAILPRLSLLYKFSPKVTSRIGGGLGYKPPTPFTEESERLQYAGVLPVNAQTNSLERSYGFNGDVNYRTRFGDVSFSINQLLFYTRLTNPLLLTQENVGLYRFINSPGYLDSRGGETNVRLGYADFKLFLGYTYTDAQIHEGGIARQNPLTAKHRINSVLMYEVEEKLKLGLEAYYFSPQQLSDGSVGRDYWICGFMAEKLWERFSVYVNLENFLDARQTRFDTIYTGSISQPFFVDIYAPLDGFVVNGGIKLRL